MKKYTKIGVFLVSLFPFIFGCQQEKTKEYPTSAEKEKQEYSPPVKIEGHPSSGEYKISQSLIEGVRPHVFFQHFESKKDNRKGDVMVIYDGYNDYVYADYGCDDIVDLINNRHERGTPGTEEMFAYADKVFGKWKKELHEDSTPIKVHIETSTVEHEPVKK